MVHLILNLGESNFKDNLCVLQNLAKNLNQKFLIESTLTFLPLQTSQRRKAMFLDGPDKTVILMILGPFAFYPVRE